MPLIEPIIRPPAEADSFLLQVTVGCSSDQCAFCGAYRKKPFRIQKQAEVIADIEEGARVYPGIRRVFLLDGDALVLNNTQLMPILEKLNFCFPSLARIAAYANGYNITGRSLEDLKALCDRKLRLIYLGLESGSQAILERCGKRSGVEEMIAAVRRAEEAGIRSSVIVLLGLGGRKYSQDHVRATIEALNRMQPRYLSFLSLMLIPGTPLFQEAEAGVFEELSAKELLQETRDILQGLKLAKTVLRTNHASNYLALEGRLPHDQQRLLDVIEQALSGKQRLRPEFLRGL